MHTTVHIHKKRRGQSLMAASDNSPRPCRLFMTDRSSKRQYLIDTGSDVSVYPRSMIEGRRQMEEYELYAANVSRISTYGYLTLKPNFGLRREFPWRFIVANVTQPIIGSDFLSHYRLLPDMHEKKLIDGKTGLSAPGTPSTRKADSIKAVHSETEYHHLLAKFPAITLPSANKETVRHNTVHFIKTTSGQPETCRPRRLAPDKLKIAKAEFDLLMQA